MATASLTAALARKNELRQKMPSALALQNGTALAPAELDELGLPQKLDAPTKELRFVSPKALKKLTDPQSLNGGHLHDIYIKRQDDFEEPELLEVQYCDDRGQTTREIIFVDPLYAQHRPRICVSIEGVQAMHRVMGVLSRKVDNLVHNLRDCRSAYYHELVCLKDQISRMHFQEQVTTENQESKSKKKELHTTTFFDPHAFDTSISEEVLERKLKDATVAIREKLNQAKEESQRLEKRLKLYERDGAIDDPRARVERLLETVTLEKLLEYVKAAVGRSNLDDFYDMLEKLMKEWRTDKPSMEKELEDEKGKVKALVKKLVETEAQVKHQAAEITTLKQTLQEDKKNNAIEQDRLASKLEESASEIDDFRQKLLDAKREFEKREEKARHDFSNLQAAHDEVVKQNNVKDQTIQKQRLTMQKITEAGGGKMLENQSPEELAASISDTVSKKEISAVCWELSCILDEEENTNLLVKISNHYLAAESRTRLVREVLKAGMTMGMADDFTAHLNNHKEIAERVVKKVLPKLPRHGKAVHREVLQMLSADKNLAQDFTTELTKTFDEDNLIVHAMSLPDGARKAVVVDSLNALASTVKNTESDTEDSDSDCEGFGKKIIFDPANDLNKKARRALLQRLFKRMPANEVKQVAQSMGVKAKEAILKSCFQDQDPEDLARAVHVLVEEEYIQAVADGLTDDAVSQMLPMLRERSMPSADMSPKASTEGKKRVQGVGSQTEIAGVGVPLVDKDRGARQDQLPIFDEQRASEASSGSHAPKRRRSRGSSGRATSKKERPAPLSRNGSPPSQPESPKGGFGKRSFHAAPPNRSESGRISFERPEDSSDRDVKARRSVSERLKVDDDGDDSPRSTRTSRPLSEPPSPTLRKLSSEIDLDDEDDLDFKHAASLSKSKPSSPRLSAANQSQSESDPSSPQQARKPKFNATLGSGLDTPPETTTPRGVSRPSRIKKARSAKFDSAKFATSDGLSIVVPRKDPIPKRNAECQTSVRVLGSDHATGFASHLEVHEDAELDDKAHETDVVMELAQLCIYFLEHGEGNDVMLRAQIANKAMSDAIVRTKLVVDQHINMGNLNIEKLHRAHTFKQEIDPDYEQPDYVMATAAAHTRAVLAEGPNSRAAMQASLALRQTLPLPDVEPETIDAIMAYEHSVVEHGEGSPQAQAASHAYSEALAVRRRDAAATDYHDSVAEHGAESSEAHVASQAYAHATAVARSESAVAVYHQAVADHGEESPEARAGSAAYAHAVAVAEQEHVAVLFRERVAEHGDDSEEVKIVSSAYAQAKAVVDTESAAMRYAEAVAELGEESAQAREASEAYDAAVEQAHKAEEQVRAIAEMVLKEEVKVVATFQQTVDKQGGLGPVAIAASMEYTEDMKKHGDLHVEEVLTSVKRTQRMAPRSLTLPPDVIVAAAVYARAMDKQDLMPAEVKVASDLYKKATEEMTKDARKAAADFEHAVKDELILPPHIVADCFKNAQKGLPDTRRNSTTNKRYESFAKRLQKSRSEEQSRVFEDGEEVKKEVEEVEESSKEAGQPSKERTGDDELHCRRQSRELELADTHRELAERKLRLEKLHEEREAKKGEAMANMMESVKQGAEQMTQEELEAHAEKMVHAELKVREEELDAEITTFQETSSKLEALVQQRPQAFSADITSIGETHSASQGSAEFGDMFAEQLEENQVQLADTRRKLAARKAALEKLQKDANHKTLQSRPSENLSTFIDSIEAEDAELDQEELEEKVTDAEKHRKKWNKSRTQQLMAEIEALEETSNGLESEAQELEESTRTKPLPQQKKTAKQHLQTNHMCVQLSEGYSQAMPSSDVESQPLMAMLSRTTVKRALSPPSRPVALVAAVGNMGKGTSAEMPLLHPLAAAHRRGSLQGSPGSQGLPSSGKAKRHSLVPDLGSLFHSSSPDSEAKGKSSLATSAALVAQGRRCSCGAMIPHATCLGASAAPKFCSQCGQQMDGMGSVLPKSLASAAKTGGEVGSTSPLCVSPLLRAQIPSGFVPGGEASISQDEDNDASKPPTTRSDDRRTPSNSRRQSKLLKPGAAVMNSKSLARLDTKDPAVSRRTTNVVDFSKAEQDQLHHNGLSWQIELANVARAGRGARGPDSDSDSSNSDNSNARSRTSHDPFNDDPGQQSSGSAGSNQGDSKRGSVKRPKERTCNSEVAERIMRASMKPFKSYGHSGSARDERIIEKLQTRVDKHLKSDSFSDTRKALGDLLGKNEMKDIDTSIGAIALQSFAAIVAFLSSNSSKSLEEAMKTSVQSALRIYQSMGAGVDPTLKFSATYKPFKFNANVFQGSPVVSDAEKAQDQITTQAPNAEEWLNFFSKGESFVKPTAMHRHHPRQAEGPFTRQVLLMKNIQKVGTKAKLAFQGGGNQFAALRGATQIDDSALRLDAEVSSPRRSLPQRNVMPRLQADGGPDQGLINLEVRTTKQSNRGGRVYTVAKLTKPPLPQSTLGKTTPVVRELVESPVPSDTVSPAVGDSNTKPEAGDQQARWDLVANEYLTTEVSPLPRKSQATATVRELIIDLPESETHAKETKMPELPTSSGQTGKDEQSREQLANSSTEHGASVSEKVLDLQMKFLPDRRMLPHLTLPENSKHADLSVSEEVFDIKSVVGTMLAGLSKVGHEPEGTASAEAAAEGRHVENASQAKPHVPPLKLTPEQPEFVEAEMAEVERSQSSRQAIIFLSGHAMGQTSGSQTERAPRSPPRDSPQKSEKQRVTASTVVSLVNNVREQLEKNHGSLAAAWVHIEASHGEARLTLGALQKGLVQGGVSPHEARLLLQAILEHQAGAAGSTPGNSAPSRQDFFAALLSGKLPQKAFDTAQRRLGQGTAWSSEGQVSSNFRLGALQDTKRDANTILTGRIGR